MFWFYRLLFLPGLLLAAPYYLHRMFRRGDYQHDFHHRFGLIDRPPPKAADVTRVWIQAVSVGEVQAIIPLVEKLVQRPKTEVIVTTTTSTGYRILRQRLSAKVTKTGIFPIDFWLFSRHAWRRLDIDVAILMEGELWPEHIRQAKLRGAGVVLLNGRLSDRSYARHMSFPWVAGRLLPMLDCVFCSSEMDRERFCALGADPEKTLMPGNLKFDVSPSPLLDAEARRTLKAEIGLGDNSSCVLLGSSTWSGEERFLIETMLKARNLGIPCKLLLVPRHAERKREIVELLRSYELRSHFRSEQKEAPGELDIYIGDSTGELVLLSQVADLAFVGKSLPPHEGGQTPIEAAALGIPLVYGPHMSNFRQVCHSLECAGAALRGDSEDSCQAQLIDLLQNPGRRQALSRAAVNWHTANQGASERTLRELEPHLIPRSR